MAKEFGGASDADAGEETKARAARRIVTERWRDPRLGIGLLLVAASVAGTTWIVSAAGARDSVYVATRAIAPGEPLAGAGLTVAEVNLDGRLDHYLPATSPIGPDDIALRAVDAGELVARSVIGSADALDLRAVPIPISGALPAGLRVGGAADLWLIPDPDEKSAQQPSEAAPSPSPEPADPTPTLLVRDLIVREIDEDAGALGLRGGSASVQVLVPTSRLAEVLAAVNGPGTVALAPVLGGSDRG